MYDVLGVKIEEFGESFYNNMIPEVNKELEDTGLAADENGMYVCMYIGRMAISLCIYLYIYTVCMHCMYVCMHIFPICTVRTYVVCIPSDSIPYIDYLDNFMYV